MSPVAMRAPGVAGGLRTDVSVVLWLKGKDLGGTRNPVAARVGLAAYMLVTCALLAGAGQMYQIGPLNLPTIRVTLLTLCLLWGVLPVFGGSGVVESAASMAPYPVRGRVHLMSAWLSAVLEPQYALTVPAVTAALVAAYGPAAVLPTVAFVVGASAVGQLLAWVVAGGLRPTRGVGLGGSLLAMALVVGTFLFNGGGAFVSLGLLPATWLLNGCRAGAGGLWLQWLGWSALVAFPALLLTGFGTRLVRRAVVATAVGQAPRAARRRHPIAPLPTSSIAALASAATRGVMRSVAFRSAALMAFALPFLCAAVLPGVTAIAVVSMTVISGGTALAANAWAFEAGGVVLWLSAPVSRVHLVLARAAATGISLLVLVCAVAVGAVLAGVALGGPGAAGFAALLVPVVTFAGLRTSTKYPTMVDLDSLRGRPTTQWAAVTYALRTALGAALLIILWGVPGYGPAAAACAAALYCVWALWSVARGLRDGAMITAALATTR